MCITVISQLIPTSWMPHKRGHGRTQVFKTELKYTFKLLAIVPKRYMYLKQIIISMRSELIEYTYQVLTRNALTFITQCSNWLLSVATSSSIWGGTSTSSSSLPLITKANFLLGYLIYSVGKYLLSIHHLYLRSLTVYVLMGYKNTTLNSSETCSKLFLLSLFTVCFWKVLNH